MITPKIENKVIKPDNLSQYKDIVMFYLHNFPVPGVPSRDLTQFEVDKYGGLERLLATGAFAEKESDE